MFPFKFQFQSSFSNFRFFFLKVLLYGVLVETGVKALVYEYVLKDTAAPLISPETTPNGNPQLHSKPAMGFSQNHLLGAFILGGGIVIFIGFVLLICYKLRIFQLLKQWGSRKRCLEFESSLQIRRFRLEEVEKATKSFSRDYLIGTRVFGKVYVGVFEDDRTLAVKRAHDNSFQSLQEFKNEVELISKVKHRNLVGLVGYCHEAGVKALVYEYIPNGSLLEYIVGRGGKTLSWRQRVNIAIGAAK
ncbi:hypothetical protein MKX03_023679, partial [Papaver bracteatum]